MPGRDIFRNASFSQKQIDLMTSVFEGVILELGRHPRQMLAQTSIGMGVKAKPSVLRMAGGFAVCRAAPCESRREGLPRISGREA
jgi:hypothetical protein